MTHSQLLSEWRKWDQSVASAMAFLDWCEDEGYYGLIGVERFLPVHSTDAKGNAIYSSVVNTLIMYGHDWLTRTLEMNAHDECKMAAKTVAKSATFPERLKALREKSGLSIPDLARASWLSDDAIRKWESGERQPTWDAVQKLATALGVTTDAFRTA